MRVGPVWLLLPVLTKACGGQSLCGNRIIKQLPSHADKTAYIYLRDCGATTGFSTNIAIGHEGGSLTDASLVFSADDNHQVATAEGDAIWLRSTWDTPTKLTVRYASGTRIFKKSASSMV